MYSNTLIKDAYLTKNPEKLADKIKELIPDLDKYVVIEPSCGYGDWFKFINFDKAYDIETRVDVDFFEESDFLTITSDDLDTENLIFIGNPPFGKNSSLAIKFCQHCCELKAKYICFILPALFKTDKIKNKAFNEHYHLVYETDYNEFYIIENGKSKNKFVNCVFQIWKYETIVREITQTKQVLTNKYFKFITKTKIKDYDENLIYSIRRVGSKSGELTKGKHVSPEDHFYIIFNENVNVEKFIEEYNKIEFDFSKCQKQKNINKTDLNIAVNLINYC